jgi:YaiO family outer membrane protein
MKIFASLAAIACAAALAAAAQEAPSLKLATTLEMRVSGARLTGGQGGWLDESVLATAPLGNHVLHAEVSHQRHFGDSGFYAGVLDTYTIDRDWYVAVGAGAGEHAFFLPRLRVDALLHRKVGAVRRIVILGGPGHARWPDGHVDRMWSLGALYYFPSRWVLQAGVRFNESDPGSVRTRQYQGALTYGAGGADEVTLRAAKGREGYQPIAPGLSLVDFPSREAALLWRHRLDASNGLTLSLDHYRNPFYERNGASIGWYTALP